MQNSTEKLLSLLPYLPNTNPRNCLYVCPEEICELPL